MIRLYQLCLLSNHLRLWSQWNLYRNRILILYTSLDFGILQVLKHRFYFPFTKKNRPDGIVTEVIFFCEKVNCFCTRFNFAKLVVLGFDFKIAERNTINQTDRLQMFEVRFVFKLRYVKRERHLHLAISF